MAERELFQIGEVAKMYHLSVGTLRHYEQVGLLKPEYTDPATGYRYYSVRQFEQLTNIRYLRALGLPLDEIAATLHDRDVDNIAEALRRQKELIARKKQELEIMERKIDHRLAQLEDARRSELDCIRLVEQPALRLVLLRDSVKFNSYLWLERLHPKDRAGSETAAELHREGGRGHLGRKPEKRRVRALRPCVSGAGRRRCLRRPRGDSAALPLRCGAVPGRPQPGTAVLRTAGAVPCGKRPADRRFLP